MRELTGKEISQVSGGIGPTGAVLGAAIGGGTALVTGGTAGDVIAGTLLGAVSGFFGSIATATTGITRVMFGSYSIETGILGGTRSS